jgi:hypothetical protein
MGAFVQNPAVAREVAEEQERLKDPTVSWKLSLERGRVVWRDAVRGRRRAWHAEPGATWRRTAVAWLARVLPVEEQL